MRRTAGRDTGRSEPLKQNQAGWNEYTKGRQADKAARAARNTSLRDKHAEERATLATRQKAHRASVFSGDWKGKGDVLNTMRSVIAAQQAVEKLNLQEQHKAERAAMQQTPYPNYEQWLRDKGAPELAERWRYKDSPEQQSCIITGKTAQQIPPRDIRDFEHRIIGREVSYRLRGAGGFGPEAFIDRGKNIAVLDHKSPAAVTAALQLGAQKFGGKLTVTGNDEYKRLCVQLAVKHGIQIVNPELQQLVADEKQHIEQQRVADRQAQAEEQKRINARMVKKQEPEQTRPAPAPSLSKPSTQPAGLEAQPSSTVSDKPMPIVDVIKAKNEVDRAIHRIEQQNWETSERPATPKEWEAAAWKDAEMQVDRAWYAANPNNPDFPANWQNGRDSVANQLKLHQDEPRPALFNGNYDKTTAQLKAMLASHDQRLKERQDKALPIAKALYETTVADHAAREKRNAERRIENAAQLKALKPQAEALSKELTERQPEVKELKREQKRVYELEHPGQERGGMGL